MENTMPNCMQLNKLDEMGKLLKRHTTDSRRKRYSEQGCDKWKDWVKNIKTKQKLSQRKSLNQITTLVNSTIQLNKN